MKVWVYLSDDKRLFFYLFGNPVEMWIDSPTFQFLNRNDKWVLGERIKNINTVDFDWKTPTIKMVMNDIRIVTSR